MKTKNPSKKKTLLHFTLATGLIVGIWVTANANSNPSPNHSDLFAEVLQSDNAVVIEEQSAAHDENEASVDSNSDVGSENFSEPTIDEISEVRGKFDVTNADEVKNVQRILGLEQDGMFGPKTLEAYLLAIAEDEARKLTLAKDSGEQRVIPQPKKEILTVVSTPTNNLTTLNIKTTVPGNNAMLD